MVKKPTTEISVKKKKTTDIVGFVREYKDEERLFLDLFILFFSLKGWEKIYHDVEKKKGCKDDEGEEKKPVEREEVEEVTAATATLAVFLGGSSSNFLRDPYKRGESLSKF